MNEYKSVSKYLSKKKNKFSLKNFLYSLFVKILICIIIVLIILIIIKIDKNNSKVINNFLYENNLNFASLNKWYQEKFGDILPFQSDTKKNITPVFSENLKYENANIYKDGVELSVTDSYLVPILEDGIVVFIGEKDDYKNTIIVQQTNGIDVWYGNIKTPNVQLYDYVSKGEFLGESNEKLYLVFQKDGDYLNYKDYLK